MLSLLSKNYNSNNIDLYCDNKLSVFKNILDSKQKNVKQGAQKVQAFDLYVVTVNGKYAKPRLKKEGLGVKGGVFAELRLKLSLESDWYVQISIIEL